MAASSSMTRMRGFTLFDFDRVQRALLDLWLVQIQGEDVSRPRRGGQPAEIVDRANRMAVHFEQNVAALDVGVEGRTHRLHAGDDDALRALRELEPRRVVRIDLAHRETERRTALTRRLRPLVLIGIRRP